MKVILFDILRKSKKSIKIEHKIYTFGECIYVYLNEDIVCSNNIYNKCKNYILLKYITRIFKSKKFNEDNYSYIASYNLDKNSELKNILTQILDNRFNEVLTNNTIKKNSIKYLKQYTTDKKILCVINNKIDIPILLEYIEKFKIVDLLWIGNNIDNKFIQNIDNINKDYGSSISFVKSNDITMYDVYVIFNDVSLDRYLINKKCRVLSLIKSDDDIYSQEYKIYNMYAKEIYNKENYSKTRLGKLINICKNSI